ncbi:MAG TPA: SRPBCC family protein [Polyangiaceae bacterium]|nr:SRPBCC family protein [Polyangiaceae bacterium]
MLEVSITRGQATERSQAPRWVAAALLSAGLTYLFDPVSGRRRRARVRDLGAHWARLGSVAVRKTRTDLQQRARGVLAIARARSRGDEVVSDETLVARVRARLGTVVSHPHAVEVEANEGTITLRGPILEHEAPRALRVVRRLRGVREIDDRLERHAESDNVPALQGGVERRRRSELLQENWTPAVRLLAGAAGAALFARAARSGSRGGAVLGAGLFLRAATNLPVRRMLGMRAPGQKAIVLQKTIHVDASPEELFEVFRNARALPRFMSHVASVEVDGKRSRWEVYGPFGTRVHWSAEITEIEENRLIAWQSTPDSRVRTNGVIRFDPDPRGGTVVHVRMTYDPPAGIFGHWVAELFRVDPKHALDDDLLRLKSLLENGKARAHGETVTRDEVLPPVEPEATPIEETIEVVRTIRE